MRIANTILNLVSVALVGAGLALIATFFVGPSFINPDIVAGKASASPEAFNAPVLSKSETINNKTAKSTETKSAKADSQKREVDGKQQNVYSPDDKSLFLTVPGMRRVQDSAVPPATGNDEEALRENAGIHLKGTGYPWQRNANVYIAGHRLGYPSTESFLAFFDLDKLEKGDEVQLADSNGRQYKYRVYKKMIVDPSDIYVTRPVDGKNVVTLQTCTLPDYSQRLIVRAERVS